MKIAKIESFLVDGGWRPWIYTKIETDDGIIGYGECSDVRAPQAVVGAIEDLKPFLLGKDPRAFEMRYWDMKRRMRQGLGGVAAKAISGTV
jgi:galactonate dehydratase